MHVNLCMHILASTCQDGGNPFPVIRLPVVNSVTDSSRHQSRAQSFSSSLSAVGRRDKLWDNGIFVPEIVGHRL